MSNEMKPENDFYNSVLSQAEKVDFKRACEVEGLDEEIALFRVKIKALLSEEKVDVKLLMAATNMLSRLVKTRFGITKSEKKGLAEVVKNVIENVSAPLGVIALKK
jgi:hypothetical protein